MTWVSMNHGTVRQMAKQEDAIHDGAGTLLQREMGGLQPSRRRFFLLDTDPAEPCSWIFTGLKMRDDEVFLVGERWSVGC